MERMTEYGEVKLMEKAIMPDKQLAIRLYEEVKECILYAFPLRWTDPYRTERSRKGHCFSKAELLMFKLQEHEFKVKYVVGYYVNGLPGFLMPKFLDAHSWVSVFVGNKWLALDPTPDKAIAPMLGDTEPGTHLHEPEYVYTFDDVPPWFKDVYNHWLTFPYKVFINGLLIIRRSIYKIKKLWCRE